MKLERDVEAGQVAPAANDDEIKVADAAPTLDEAARWQRTLVATVEPRFIDKMGHMNVQWYVHLFDRATWRLLALHGLTEPHFKSTKTGAFAVEQRVRYFSELRLGAEVYVHSRVLSIREKVITMQHAMIDAARARVAAVIETAGLHMDLKVRRTSPFPEAAVASLRASMEASAR